MKRFLIIVSLMINLVFANIYGDEYILYGNVFNYDWTSGTAQTPNSFASLNAYRKGIAGQIGHQENGENELYPHKIYAADGTSPAYFFTDAGSSAWALTPPAEGQIVIAVLETGEPENGWSGDSYIACTTTVITANDINNEQTDLPPVNLKLLPAPAIISEGENYITVQWTGIDNDFITGYSLYRSDDGGVTYNKITVTGQASGGPIFYTDNDPGLSAGIIYYYKIAVNFIWGGGGGAPEYYETFIKSKPSLGAQIKQPTFTPTVSATSTETETFTLTNTETYTFTFTKTSTETATLTPTFTYTVTFTATDTATSTPSFTTTLTFTFTPTFTETATLIPIATNTPVLLSDTLVSNIKKQKIIIFNNPVKGNKIKLGIFSEETGNLGLYFYNIKAQLVNKLNIQIIGGINIIEGEINNVSPGVYILITKINNKNFPLRKIAIVK